MRMRPVRPTRESTFAAAIFLVGIGLTALLIARSGSCEQVEVVAQSAPLLPGADPKNVRPDFPLKVSANGRFLVDQQNRPLLIVGDTGWSLIAQADGASIRRYLDDRRERGFNATIVNLLEHKFSLQPPRTRAGLEPFKIPGDFSTPNEAYCDFAHEVVAEAGQRGIVAWLAPAYLGSNGGDEGFFREIKAGGPAKLQAYGQFIGRRFKDLPNIVWLLGGDYTPAEADLWTINELGRAISKEDPVHLMTVHAAPETSIPARFGQEKWLTVSTVYSYKPELFRPLLAEYEVQPCRPYVLIETTYEGEHNATPDQIRRQAYWAMLAGACGQFFGNNPIWHFDGPGLFPSKLRWEQALKAPGSLDMARLRALFLQLPWERFEPEKGHSIVTGGYGQGVNTALTACTPDGQWSVTYVPSTGREARELTVNTASFHGPVSARWYNPASGQFTHVQEPRLSSNRMQRFRTPGDNGSDAGDWVLVLEGARK